MNRYPAIMHEMTQRRAALQAGDPPEKSAGPSAMDAITGIFQHMEMNPI
jgi:hypothetical protein